MTATHLRTATASLLMNLFIAVLATVAVAAPWRDVPSAPATQAESPWCTLEPLPMPVHGVIGAAFLNGFIHLPGGGTERGGNSGSTHHRVYHVTHWRGAVA
ncbi:MAG TPA: hypothetical protein VFN74_24265 [Chloroflexota bacterium]|nr:hypothetical protein [Chloroflexota bacterium]